MYYRYIFHLIIIIILSSGCASQIPITGGDKDTNPPVLVSTFPDSSNQKNFTSNTIKFEFNEAITDNNLDNNITIFPSVEHYNFRIKKKTLFIEFEEPLIHNTTYTVNVTNAIKDIQEGLQPTNAKLFFSTGPYIDSMQVKGQVLSNLSHEPQQCFIGLYPVHDTVLPSTNKPTYFLTTNSTGSFHFTHLKNQPFQIYAFNDKNHNQLWDAQTENIAFLDSPIHPYTNDTSLILYTESYDTTTISLESYTSTNHHLQLNMTRGIKSYQLNSPKTTFDYLSKDSQTLTIYPTTQLQDSIETDILFTDSLNNQYQLTRIFPIALHSKNKNLLQSILPQNRLLKPNQPTITLHLNEPIDSTNSKLSSITLNDSLVSQVRLINPLQVKLTYNIQSRDTNQLSIPSASISSIYGTGIDSLTTTFFKETNSYYGTLSGELPTLSSPVILRLQNNKTNSVTELVQPDKQFSITRIDPGEYTLYLILDRNQNGIYDKGNIFTSTLPESVLIHPNTLKIRANWIINNISEFK